MRVTWPARPRTARSRMATTTTRTMVLLTLGLAWLATTQSFFLPSFSSSYSKKPDASPWQVQQDSLYSGQHYSSAALPVAVPYPVPIPAQVQMAPHPATPLSLPSMHHNMQLVPCLCSVPKEDIEDAGSVVVQSSQQISN